MAVLTGIVPSNATPVELLSSNREFEDPTVSGTYQILTSSEVPGWSNTGDALELVIEGGFGSPTNGTDGQPSGQHLEIVAGAAQIGHSVQSDVFAIPAGLIGSTATLSFDYWYRYGYNEFKVEVIDVTQGTVVFTQSFDNPLGYTAPSWDAFADTSIPVVAGNDYRIDFTSLDGTHGGAHIDDVSFVVESSDDPPATNEGDLYVTGVARVDGGLDLVGNGLAIYQSEADYTNDADPIIELKADGTVRMPPQGDISMGAFTTP